MFSICPQYEILTFIATRMPLSSVQSSATSRLEIISLNSQTSPSYTACCRRGLVRSSPYPKLQFKHFLVKSRYLGPKLVTCEDSFRMATTSSEHCNVDHRPICRRIVPKLQRVRFLTPYKSLASSRISSASGGEGRFAFVTCCPSRVVWVNSDATCTVFRLVVRTPSVS